MVGLTLIHTRGLTTSAVALGKHNFRKFLTYGKRGTKIQKERMSKNPNLDPQVTREHDRGLRPVGLSDGKQFHIVPEMIPEIIVPDLAGFKLKPYVSYRVPDVVQSEFTPQDLFYAVYSEKIAQDFKNNKLDEDSNPIEPSEEELLTAEEAKNKVLCLGSDIYSSKR
ncbi:hypothetical protein Pmani_034162 [Petrolisthes manimaculis]|uniref:39S ribosomal protein L41, mitochondrial n=1 Tax=Petrolisthes manimaculis TaxID=1843537 RepID=A0AAE1TPP8_9EUCA|nr:hypothetical protein Pmani_034162 [Petrolisthes manimaculis]